MLKQRIITALILAPIAIGGIFFLDPIPFAWFVGGVMVIGAWEWANLSGVTGQAGRLGYAVLIGALIALAIQMPAALILTPALLFWLIAFYWVSRYPESTSQWGSVTARLIMGVLILVPTVRGLVQIRTGIFLPDPTLVTLWLILYVMVLVWGADVGAYFAGRAFGNRKLAPNVSPGKSWAGVYGGLATVALIAVVAGSLLSFSLGQTLLLVIISLATGCVSVLGDLVESMVKRYRGIKDSSQLLPGHGGVMDRIDSLTAAVPSFVLFMILAGWL